MEKHRHIFEQFATFDNMYDGYLLARKNKRYRQEVLAYSANLEENLIDSVNRLQWKTYHTGTPYQFYEYFPKIRIIHSLPFYDRVINCAAYNVLWPIYANSFYEHSYGSIPGRGTKKAVDCLQNWMQIAKHKPEQWYIGKMDIAKFFFRIPVEVQLRELGRPLDDPDMMWFLETAIRTDGRPFGLPLTATDVTHAELVSGIGMQVGSLISQTTANVVLTPLDHYIKRVLRVPRYIRYMDDMIIMAPSKSQINDAIGAVDFYLQTELGLQLNGKTAVIPNGQGVQFIGRRIWPEKVELRRSTSLQMKRHLAYVKDAYSKGEVDLDYACSVIQSYLGLMKYCNCDALRNQVLEDYVLIRHSKSDSAE
jgi:retron-type reverse transcriptase